MKFLIFTLFLLGCSNFQSQTKAEQEELIYWGSDASAEIFSRSIKADFFPLSNHFETQSNKVYCGPTSAVIVLNTLRLGKETIPDEPTVLFKSEMKYLSKNANLSFKKYTQRNVFENLEADIKSKHSVLGKPDEKGKKDFGFQIAQFAKFLRSHKLKVEEFVFSEEIDLPSMHKKMVNNLKTKNDFVLINYKRSALGQKGGGHISPIAAYDSQTDRFLIMDVNPNRYPWVWVHSKKLFSSMQTLDTTQNRGLLLISE